MPPPDPTALRAAELRWRCDPACVAEGGVASDEFDRVGQARALAALRLGLEIDAPGYHVVVSGLPGSGRVQTVKRLLAGLADRCAVVPDRGFVHGFADPARPRLLELPGGRIRPFAARMDELARDLIARLEALGEDEATLKRRRRLEEALGEASGRSLAEVAAAARGAGLSLYEVKEHGFARPALGVEVGGEIFPIEALRLLAQQGRIEPERAEAFEAAGSPLQPLVERVGIELRRAARERARELAAFDRDQARAVIRPEFDEVAQEFPFEPVRRLLESIERWILDRRDQPHGEKFARALRRRLAVNVILDHADREATPIVVLNHPSPANLFGSIDVRTHRTGVVAADHRGIRAGALVEADGGYLVLKASDVLAEEGVWAALRRALKLQQVEIAPLDGLVSLKPEPIPTQVKVVLVTEAEQERYLEEHDPEFREIFKVRAEFDDEIERTDANVRRYAALLRRIAADEKLLPLSDDAATALIEEAARRAERGGVLSTRLGPLADLVREADHFAKRDGGAAIAGAHTRLALAAAREREDLPRRRFLDHVRAGTMLLSTSGARAGQVNGLTVVSSGTLEFGRPVRITATVAAGDHGLLNIEREVQLSGEIHDKGVFILGALLRERFAQNHPLALSASVCFEQTYAPIEGDSAAAAEWFALVSAIADVPIRQALAVTGSINQKGEVQPVGGLAAKIEGFFDVCEQAGLDGTQGVVIPRRNAADLMLHERVVEAVAAGRFAVHAIDHVDQGIELLTGLPAGALGPDGRYPKESINGRCADHLSWLAEIARDARSAHDAHAGAPPAAPGSGAPPPPPAP